MGTEIKKAIDKNYEYYLQHQEEFNKKYNNKYIIVKDEKIYGVFDNLEDAIQEAKKLEAGTYIIQQCVKRKEPQTFHTRVIFNE